MNRYLIFVLAICVPALFVSIKKCRSLQDERDRFERNQHALLEDVTCYMTASQLSAARAEALELKISEMEKYESSLTKTVKELNIKLKNVVSASEIHLRDSVRIVTEVIYKDSVICFDYKDRFNELSGCIEKDSVQANISHFDSLSFVVSKVPKYKFLWWSWGVKGIELNVVSQNPNAVFDYVKLINIR